MPYPSGAFSANTNTSAGIYNASTGMPYSADAYSAWTSNASKGYGYAAGTSNNNNNSATPPNAYDPLAGIKLQQEFLRQQQKSEYASAAATMRAAFSQYGLSGLNGYMTSLIMAGKPAAEVAILLRNTNAYKNRFPAMEYFAKKGQAISEGEYITKEIAYNEAFAAAGLSGYVKSPKQYAAWMMKNVSPTQIAQRLDAATTMINNSNSNIIDAFQRYYGITKKDLLTFYLDPKQAGPELLTKAKAAMLGGSAQSYGIGLSEELSRTMVDAGINNASEAFAKTAQTREELQRLGAISGTDVTTAEIVQANTGISTSAEKKITGLASQERARFQGRGTGTSMIDQSVSGSY